MLRFARDARRDNLEARLGRIRVPALLVWGLNDRITPPRVGERFHALIQTAQLCGLAHCGHAPMLERPGPFAAAVTAWLDATRMRRTTWAPSVGGIR